MRRQRQGLLLDAQRGALRGGGGSTMDLALLQYHDRQGIGLARHLEEQGQGHLEVAVQYEVLVGAVDAPARDHATCVAHTRMRA